MDMASIRLCTVDTHWNDFDGWGVYVKSHRSENTGMFISTLEPGAAFDRAGLKSGDKIIEVNGVNVESDSHGEVVEKIKQTVTRVQLLVANEQAVEIYRERNETITTQTPGVVTMKQSRKPPRISDIDQFIENKIVAYKSWASSDRKYFLDVLLQVPLIFLIHQVITLGPTSNYTIPEFLFFILRILFGLMLFGCWGVVTYRMATLCICMSGNMFIGWMMEKVYLTFENEAEGICQDKWLPWREDAWWVPALITLVLQTSHMLYFLKEFKVPSEARALVVLVSLLPYLSCMLGAGLSYILPIHYYVSKCIFLVSTFTELLYTSDRIEHDNQGKVKIPELPGRWFFRDVLALFAIIYIASCAVFDIALTWNISQVFILSYLPSLLGTWCTSLLLVAAFGAMFTFISNLSAAIILSLLKGESDIRGILNSPLGHRTNLTFTAYCIEAGILTVSESDRILNMESVLFLTLFTIINQAWDLTEQQFLFIVNSGDSNRCLNFLRVLIVALLLLMVPTCLTVYLSPILGVDWWLMFNLSGNLSVLIRAILVFVEIMLVSITWYVDNNLDRLEDAIYIVRICKSAAILICGLLSSYYRYYAPFFSAWWFYRICAIINNYGLVSFVLCKNQWIVYKVRRQGLMRIHGLPDALSEELEEYKDDVCSVCYAAMTSAKKLPCQHLFHTNCLRKWFQIKVTCPLCNTEALKP